MKTIALFVVILIICCSLLLMGFLSFREQQGHFQEARAGMERNLHSRTP